MTAVMDPDTKPSFTYHPKDGGEAIVFPSAQVLWEDVDGVKPTVFLWRIRKLNEPYQTFAFIERSGVSDEMAERVLELDADERAEFFKQWFNGVDTPEMGLPPES